MADWRVSVPLQAGMIGDEEIGFEAAAAAAAALLFIIAADVTGFAVL